jgi:hypothetical protein
MTKQNLDLEAYNYPRRFAELLWAEHYKTSAPDWQVLNDLIGVLTQIDSRVSGLTTTPLATAKGRFNSGDETGGTVRRFGFDCTGTKPEICPATNGAYVEYWDYVKLFRKKNT